MLDFREVYVDPLTPLRFLERTSYVFGDKIGVIYGEKKFTFSEFASRVNRLANGVRKLIAAKDDRVAFLSPNTPAILEAHFGIPKAGAVLVPINIRLSSREIAYILNHSESKVLFVDSEFAPLIEPIRKEIPTVKSIVAINDVGPTDGLEAIDYEKFLASASEEQPPFPVKDENDMITINYTSGTTGLPKGAIYTHRGAYLNAIGEALETKLTSESVYLWTLPMFHCNGWCFPWAVTAIGGQHICIRKVDPPDVFRLIEEKGVTHFCAAPTVLIMLLNHPAARDFRLKRKLTIVTAAAPPSPKVIRMVEEMGAELIHVYGLTEVYGPHTVCEWKSEWDSLPIEERARVKARQGVSYLHAIYTRVVDENMNDVPRDGKTVGEIIMKGNNVMAGYFKDPEATKKAFRGGWFHSGDLAVMHPDGYAEIMDRGKDIIISGGENISSQQVEKVIFEYPDVIEVAVIAVPDEKWGEVPKAFIVPKPGPKPTAGDIIAHCRKHLAHFKCPKHIEFIPELPKTSTGKIQKYVLKDREWKAYEKRVQ